LLLKKRLLSTLRILISVAFLSYLFWLLDLKRLTDLFSSIDKRLIIIAPFLILAGLMASAIRWKYLLESLHTCQSIARLYGYYLIGVFYSILLPGAIGGDVIRIGICSSETKSSITRITASVLMERTCGVAVLFIAASLFVFTLPQKMISDFGSLMIIGLPSITAIMIIISLSAYFLTRKYKYIFMRKEHTNRWISKLVQLIDLATEMPIHIIIITFVLTALFQASDILTTFIISKALNINIPLSLFFAIMPVVYVATILPISIGGLGVREGVFVYLLSKIGILPSDAVTLSFLIYVNRIIVGFVGGTVHLFWKKAIHQTS